MTEAELKSVVDFCKANGIRRYKTPDLELEFGGDAPDPQQVKAFAKLMEQGLPTEEEVLYHSAPGGIPLELMQPPPEAPKTARGKR